MKFLNVIGDWVNRYFSNEEAIYLVALIAFVIVLLAFLGGYLAPVLTGLVFAFLLQGLVVWLQRLKMPRIVAVWTSFMLFVGAIFAFVLIVVPLMWQQMQGLVSLAPTAILRLREGLAELSQRFPDYVTEEQVSGLGSMPGRGNWVT